MIPCGTESLPNNWGRFLDIEIRKNTHDDNFYLLQSSFKVLSPFLHDFQRMFTARSRFSHWTAKKILFLLCNHNFILKHASLSALWWQMRVSKIKSNSWMCLSGWFPTKSDVGLKQSQRRMRNWLSDCAILCWMSGQILASDWLTGPFPGLLLVERCWGVRVSLVPE